MPQKGTSSITTAAAQSTQISYMHAPFLSTILVNILNKDQKTVSCRALLDPGSQINFISSEMVKRANLKTFSTVTTISGIGDKSMNSQRSLNLRINSRINAFSETITCSVISKITQRLPQTFVPFSSFKIPKTIKLADPNFNVPADVDLLIGADLCWRILCVGQIKPNAFHPTLQKTLFGWIVAGNSSKNAPLLSNVATTLLSINDQLSVTLNKFWNIETLPCKTKFTSEEELCEKHFRQNLTRNNEGRFIVRLPKKEGVFKTLGKSFDIARRQFFSLERRLSSQPLLNKQYSQFIDDYIHLNHMREVKESCSSNQPAQIYYLPHHPVFKETSTTTKLRVVFNASCKTTTGVSQ